MITACREGKLHRNFQGYTTDNCPTLLGFGASAITMLPRGYLQNTTLIKDYREKAGGGLLATCRGAATKPDDISRRDIIGRLMCYRTTDFGTLSPEAQESARKRLALFVQDGLAEIEGTKVTITENGKLFIRLVCTAFDKYWAETNTKHAKAV
jgi:oxygen-independent coproporphyrinogen-3 oxidase